MTPAETKDRNSQRWQSMESEVYDISRMAQATALILDLYLEEKQQAVAGDCPYTGKELVKHLDQWSDAVDFMVNHLNAMAHDLRRHYQ